MFGNGDRGVEWARLRFLDELGLQLHRPDSIDLTVDVVIAID